MKMMERRARRCGPEISDNRSGVSIELLSNRQAIACASVRFRLDRSHFGVSENSHSKPLKVRLLF